MAQTLNDYLSREVAENGLPEALKKLLLAVAETSKAISAEVASAPIAGELGLAGSENVQGEDQKKLDVISNEMMCRDLLKFAPGTLSGMASEEMDHALAIPADEPVGPYLICFDPLDGSSNIDINVSIGTIFSVIPSPRGATHDITD